MYCDRKRGKPKTSRWFKNVARGVAILLTVLLVFTWSCSEREDEPPPQGKNKVVVAIKKAEQKAVEEEAVSPEPVEQQEPAVAPKSEEVSAAPPEEQESGATLKEDQKPAEAAEVKTAPEEPQEQEKIPKNSEPEQPEKGFVRIMNGESLTAVAARADVYGDFLAWPKLYRLNKERLATIRTWEGVHSKALPSGLSLRYLPPADGKAASAPVNKKPWVVTVRSRQSPGNLAVPAIKLIQNGFRVYIARAVVKNKEWLRLRVGFFESKAEALAAAEKIGGILKNKDAWIARAGTEELEKFGGSE